MRQFIQIVEDGMGQRIREWIDSFGEPLRLYRELILAPGEDIDTSRLGRHWTPVRERALSPYGRADKRGSVVVLECLASKSAVDIPATVATMRRYPDEMEIMLVPGATVELVGYGKATI